MDLHEIVESLPPEFTAEYTLGPVLGSGGQGLAVRARQNELRREVVLKFLHRPEEVAERRFLLEGGLLSRLSHPNVVRVYDLGRVSNLLYLVMEYVPGETLAGPIQRGVLGSEAVVAVADHVLAALGALHEQGIIHRDVKPENVWVGKDGTCRLLDFGIAREGSGEGLTRPGCLLGTPAYAPPEQILGEAQDARSDLYSFGVLLHEMITGVNPFDSDSMLLTLERQIGLRLGAMSPPRFPVSPALENLVLSLMHKNPANRPSSAAEVRGILARSAAASLGASARLRRTGRMPVRAPSFASVRQPITAIRRRRNRGLVLGVTFAASLLAGLAGAGALSGGTTGPLDVISVTQDLASPGLPRLAPAKAAEIRAVVERSGETRARRLALRLSGGRADPFQWDAVVAAEAALDARMRADHSWVEAALEELESSARAAAPDAEERSLVAQLLGTRLCLRAALATTPEAGADAATFVTPRARDDHGLDRVRGYLDAVRAVIEHPSAPKMGPGLSGNKVEPEVGPGLSGNKVGSELSRNKVGSGLSGNKTVLIEEPSAASADDQDALVLLTAEVASWIDATPWHPETRAALDHEARAFEAFLAGSRGDLAARLGHAFAGARRPPAPGAD